MWVALEYIRSIGPLGAPAGLLGYSQHQNLLFIQIADIVGIFGVSFLLALINAFLFSLINEFSFKRTIKIASAILIILILTFAYGGVKMAKAGGTKKIRVALIQPNFHFISDKDYDVKQVLQTLDELSVRAAAANPDLIIWPETVLRESVRLNLNLSRKIKAMVSKYNTYLLFGNPDFKKQGNKIKHYNSALLVSSNGAVVDQYDKIHPVPFWEIMPIRYYLPFLKNTDAKGSCDQGEAFTVFDIAKGKFSTLICFEGMFSDLSREFVNNGAQFLVNITNDGWSQSRAEHYQHASMNVFRAIENRVYYVRVGNSGVTEVINPYGQIISSLPVYTKGYLVENLALRKEETIYSRFGDYFGYLSLVLTGGLIGMAIYRKGDAKYET